MNKIQRTTIVKKNTKLAQRNQKILRESVFVNISANVSLNSSIIDLKKRNN